MSTNNWWEDSTNITAIRDYAHLSGLCTSENNACHSAAIIPVTLLPSKFPRDLFDLVWSLQKDLNALIDAVSRDHSFLTEALEREKELSRGNIIFCSVLKVDDFTNRLFQLYKDSREARRNMTDQIVLGIHRCDYMLDYKEKEDTPLGIKMVEMNTISVAFPFLANGHVQDLHKYVNSRYCSENGGKTLLDENSVSNAIAAACKCYGKPDACIVIVVKEKETNIYDLRLLEFDLWKRFKIKTIVRTLEEIGREMVINDQKELYISNFEVAVVYYRSCYDPEHHKSEKDWDTRLALECSRAAVCPTAAYQLAGTKKIQQVLATPGVLERFIEDQEMIKKIRSTFTGIYAMDRGLEGDRAISRALEEPHNFVLKPQREGGGYNTYGDDVRTLLERIRHSDERESYILMDMITSPAQKGLILYSVGDEIKPCPLICEVGVYGTYVRCDEKVLFNEAGGSPLVRSKRIGVDEGGAMAGGGCLDSIKLVPRSDFLEMIDNNHSK